MHRKRKLATPLALLFAGLVTMGGLCGCQTNIGGQTLPSAYYLRDDIQYFPAGEEFLLPNEVRAHEEYRAAQAARGAEAPPGF